MIRLSCPEGFTPRKTNPSPGQSPSSAQSGGDKSPRGSQAPHQISHRRQKSREGKSNGEVLDELSVVGYIDEPDVNIIFEPSGKFIFFIINIVALISTKCLACLLLMLSALFYGAENSFPNLFSEFLR